MTVDVVEKEKVDVVKSEPVVHDEEKPKEEPVQVEEEKVVPAVVEKTTVVTAKVPQPITVCEEDKKATLRSKVWKMMDECRITKFPRPATGRIPNYTTSNICAEKCAQSQVFLDAQRIKCDPDAALQELRYLILKAKKELFVPISRLQDGILYKIVPPNYEEDTLRSCSTQTGAKMHGEAIKVEDKLKMDLIVVGSVAVDQNGNRLGRGRGFGDIEYSALRDIEIADENTPVMTLVHDCQVLDGLIPESEITNFDMVIDYVVTPNSVIRTTPKREKPKTIEWSKLNGEKLERTFILKKLRLILFKDGKDVKVEGETEDPTEETLNKLLLVKPHFRRFATSNIYIGNLKPNHRVRDLKKAVRDCGVPQFTVEWNGRQGYAFLIFELKTENITTEDVIEKMKDLCIDEDKLTVEKSYRQNVGFRRYPFRQPYGQHYRNNYRYMNRSRDHRRGGPFNRRGFNGRGRFRRPYRSQNDRHFSHRSHDQNNFGDSTVDVPIPNEKGDGIIMNDGQVMGKSHYSGQFPRRGYSGRYSNNRGRPYMRRSRGGGNERPMNEMENESNGPSGQNGRQTTDYNGNNTGNSRQFHKPRGGQSGRGRRPKQNRRISRKDGIAINIKNIPLDLKIDELKDEIRSKVGNLPMHVIWQAENGTALVSVEDIDTAQTVVSALDKAKVKDKMLNAILVDQKKKETDKPVERGSENRQLLLRCNVKNILQIIVI
ncbi:hypothetical protein SNEBB_010963 [Seison nebaliae]|nr:hypothetical protein SNEBB_010963 [Seison nebaliae]